MFRSARRPTTTRPRGQRTPLRAQVHGALESQGLKGGGVKTPFEIGFKRGVKPNPQPTLTICHHFVKVTICHHLSSFVTICHYLSLFVTICHDLSQYPNRKIMFYTFCRSVSRPAEASAVGTGASEASWDGYLSIGIDLFMLVVHSMYTHN